MLTATVALLVVIVVCFTFRWTRLIAIGGIALLALMHPLISTAVIAVVLVVVLLTQRRFRYALPRLDRRGHSNSCGT